MPSNANFEAKIIELEIRSSEQEHQIEDLSNVVAEQWKVIDQLSKKLGLLSHRFLELEEQTSVEVPITRPPHW